MSSQRNNSNCDLDKFFYKIKNKRLEIKKSSTKENTKEIKKIVFLIKENIIGLKLPFNPIIMSDIEKLFRKFYNSNYPYFDEENQIYVLELHFSNFKLLNKIVTQYNFEIEENCKILFDSFIENQKNETKIDIQKNNIKIQTFDIFVNKYVDQFLKTLR